jgi:uncharacterized protein DUF1579
VSLGPRWTPNPLVGDWAYGEGEGARVTSPNRGHAGGTAVRMRLDWTFGLIAAGVFAVAPAGAQSLVAQGGANAYPGIAVAPTARTAPPARSRLEPARSILRNLVGAWRFEIWFAGNIDGPPDVSGTRVIKTLYDDLRVEWTEELDHSPIRGQGIVGFDERSSRFFGIAVDSAGSGAEFTTGILEDAEPLITFHPLSLGPDVSPAEQLVRSSALSILDPNHFTWMALDRGWRAVFTRQQ